MLLCVALRATRGNFKLKTYKHLFERISSFENLYIAYLRARKGKRFKPDVDRFTPRCIIFTEVMTVLILI
jgi:hypothetical protein